MKFLTFILLALMPALASAHNEHLFSNSTLHLISHVVLLAVFALVCYLGFRQYRKMKNSD